MEKSLAERRYGATYKMEVAIIKAICEIRGCSYVMARELFREWDKEEDGQIAMTRLINTIIY